MEEVCIAELFGLRGKKNDKKAKKRNKKATTFNFEEEDSVKNGSDASSSSSGVRISEFDFSIENFFRDMDTIATLCGEELDPVFDQSEIQRFSSSVTFLREWRDFKYPPRSIRFAYGEGSSEGKAFSVITLPQFSSAAVPKVEQLGDAKSQQSRDSVMYVGGPVWALDWCPRIHEKPDYSIKREFIAVAVHPPGSSYHKMGAPLTGRGVIQIWSLLNITEEDDKVCSLSEKRKQKSKNGGGTNDISTQIKRPRGRPRKNPKEIVVYDTNFETEHIPALAVQFPQNSAECPAPAENLVNTEEIFPATDKRKRGSKGNEATNEKSAQIKRPRGRPRKNPTEIVVHDSSCETQHLPAPSVQLPQNSAEFPEPDRNLENTEEIIPATDERKRVPKRNKVMNEKSTQKKRPRGRTKTNSKEVTMGDDNCENQSVQALAVQFPGDSAEFVSPDVAHGSCNEYAEQQNSVTKQKRAKKAGSTCYTIQKIPVRKSNQREGTNNQDISQQLTHCENAANHQPHCSSELSPPAPCSVPGDVALPRVVSCLAHNGKVAWDVKWRPTNMSDSFCNHRMGYLAVLLGNGSLEVWDVPLPHVLRAIYRHRDGTDPRFLKLEPVFKCSVLKRGGRQSIPLTVEWSVTPPHDYLLAGCHDGTVALWKFSTNSSSKCYDTKPVLCFSGDTVPIRAVAWAPFEGDPESSNLIVTAGHEGLKFWDLRNPFRPLRNLNTGGKIIYSLDWLLKPSCIIMSFEDGTMRTFSLVRVANDFPVSGETYNGKKQPWLRSSTYSSFAIWSVQVSRMTGMVAYCSADGTCFRFQLLTKAVETDYSLNRIPYYLCGSVTEEKSTLVINTPVSNTPCPPRKSYERVRHPQSFRELLSMSHLNNSEDKQMAKASNSDSHTLALCDDDDDLGSESGSEEAFSSEEQPKISELSRSNSKKAAERKSLVCRDNVSKTNTVGIDNEKSDVGNIPEVFPSKMVALHRVRWNMNKGSEKWLCFGGAGGFVRCQEVVFSKMEKKWAMKW